ncbi:shikimate kinase [Acidaminobacter sp. JC074]|uniref:AAA family ATPase n=1 Tax=Acidaminobacter sp. JC074 TaxID=2530199 RepID=UPI001F0F9814|nr:AAA family ATPase [Acidaminobacter sp. JC074]MCH4887192.1 shikimate kinase [Acidaminobacter sp. JC074]
MKPCIMILGPQAVGKMAVGMALREKYNYRLFHNHMSIELVNDLYGQLDKEAFKLVGKLRQVIFEDVFTRDLDGFTFTYMMAFDWPSEHKYVEDFIAKFESNGFTVFLVELEADVETRLERNKSDLRLKQKATKRNIEWSDNNLLESMDKYRLNSNPGEMTYERYLKINNSDLSPDQVAQMIYDYIQNK